MNITYQFDGDSVVGYQVRGQVDATMCSLAEHVHELVSFAQYSGDLPLHVNKFTILIGLVARV